MPTGKVTKQSVDAFVTPASTTFLWDDDLRGFGLRVTASGARSYVFQYRMGGREAKARRCTIGKHGTFTPASARIEAKRLALLVAQGVDPADADRERRKQAVDLAFDAYVARFATGYLATAWKDAADARRLLEREAIPVLQKMPLPVIRKANISEVLDRCRDRPAVARHLFAILRKMFRWAEGRGDLDRSPLHGMDAPPPVAARDRVLSDEELALIWEAAGSLGYPFGSMFRLLMVCGQRRDEVAGLSWSELDRSTATWTLPSSRAKNGQTHLVPLSSLAIDELDAIAESMGLPNDAGVRAWPRTGFVLTTSGKVPVSGYSKAKARLDAAIVDAAGKRVADSAAVAAWRVHDLRRTLATGLQRLGVRFEVTEAVLNHVSGAKSGVAGVYQRHDWKVEKREALDAWSLHLASVTGG